MTALHPHADLSAYLDDELAAAERTAVEAHLAGCAGCRARLAELRATASLVASLPDIVPSRRLTPRLATVPAWLAPLRTLTTLASGLSVFLFVASAILANIGWLSQGAATSVTSGAAPQRADAPAASAGQADAAARNGSGASAQASSAAKLASPSPGAAFYAVSAPPAAAQGRAAESSAAAADRASTRLQVGPSPWLWLVLAIVLGAIAIALQRRLRSP